MGYLCANFSLPRPLCSEVRPDVRDRQTDVRHADRLKRASSLITAEHNNCCIFSTLKMTSAISYQLSRWGMATNLCGDGWRLERIRVPVQLSISRLSGGVPVNQVWRCLALVSRIRLSIFVCRRRLPSHLRRVRRSVPGLARSSPTCSAKDSKSGLKCRST